MSLRKKAIWIFKICKIIWLEILIIIQNALPNPTNPYNLKGKLQVWNIFGYVSIVQFATVSHEALMTCWTRQQQLLTTQFHLISGKDYFSIIYCMGILAKDLVFNGDNCSWTQVYYYNLSIHVTCQETKRILGS